MYTVHYFYTFKVCNEYCLHSHKASIIFPKSIERCMEGKLGYIRTMHAISFLKLPFAIHAVRFFAIASFFQTLTVISVTTLSFATCQRWRYRKQRGV